MAHGFVYYRWSCEEGTFKSVLEIESNQDSILLFRSRKSGWNEKEKQKANDECISGSTRIFIATPDFSKAPTVICTQMNKKCNHLFLCIVPM